VAAVHVAVRAGPDRQRHRELAAVAVTRHQGDFAPLGGRGGGARAGADRLRQRAPQSIAGRPAEHRLRGGAPAADPVASVHRKVGVAGGVHDLPKPAPATGVRGARASALAGPRGNRQGAQHHDSDERLDEVDLAIRAGRSRNQVDAARRHQRRGK
jgi:hypothetical protein